MYLCTKTCKVAWRGRQSHTRHHSTGNSHRPWIDGAPSYRPIHAASVSVPAAATAGRRRGRQRRRRRGGGGRLIVSLCSRAVHVGTEAAGSGKWGQSDPSDLASPCPVASCLVTRAAMDSRWPLPSSPSASLLFGPPVGFRRAPFKAWVVRDAPRSGHLEGQ